MKKLQVGIIVIGFCLTSLHALPRGSFGLGVVVGEPTGLSAKYWLSRQQALDFGLAWSFPDEAVHFHSTWLYHIPGLILDPRFTVYLGLGGRLHAREDPQNEDVKLGLRFAGGVEFVYQPFSVFLELVPIFELVPKTALDLEAGLGFRFYFPTQ
jgi:hypothetical protein